MGTDTGQNALPRSGGINWSRLVVLRGRRERGEAARLGQATEATKEERSSKHEARQPEGQEGQRLGQARQKVQDCRCEAPWRFLLQLQRNCVSLVPGARNK
jgi:hypothetical protein